MTCRDPHNITQIMYGVVCDSNLLFPSSLMVKTCVCHLCPREIYLLFALLVL